MLLFSPFQYTTSTFQAVLITNGITSYAVFIYECGGMDWNGATIGWAYSNFLYEKHSLSGLFISSTIGCRHSSTSTAIAYRLGNSQPKLELGYTEGGKPVQYSLILMVTEISIGGKHLSRGRGGTNDPLCPPSP